MCNSMLMRQIELTWKLQIPTFYTGLFQNNFNTSSEIRLSMFSTTILYRQKKKNVLVTKMKTAESRKKATDCHFQAAWWYQLLISLRCSTLTQRKAESLSSNVLHCPSQNIEKVHPYRIHQPREIEWNETCLTCRAKSHFISSEWAQCTC